MPQPRLPRPSPQATPRKTPCPPRAQHPLAVPALPTDAELPRQNRRRQRQRQWKALGRSTGARAEHRRLNTAQHAAERGPNVAATARPTCGRPPKNAAAGAEVNAAAAGADRRCRPPAAPPPAGAEPAGVSVAVASRTHASVALSGPLKRVRQPVTRVNKPMERVRQQQDSKTLKRQNAKPREAAHRLRLRRRLRRASL